MNNFDLHDQCFKSIKLDFTSNKIEIEIDLYEQKTSGYKLLKLIFEEISDFNINTPNINLSNDEFSVASMDLNDNNCTFSIINDLTNDVYEFNFKYNKYFNRF
ncbi:MAG: hypothetical protein FGM14_16900 [Flavobacteriales bacterium]|nr:hypothetical protein [Flavobacteriales bacterium]